MQIQLNHGHAAKKIGTQQHAPGLPAGKDHQCQGDPADSRGHAFGPLGHADQADIGATHPRAGTAEQDRHHADAHHLVSQRVGRFVVFPDGAQDQAGAGVFQHEPDCRDDDQPQIDHQIMGEEDAPQHRHVREARNVQPRKRGRADTLVALADQRGQAQPEQRQPQPRGHLVGQRHLRQQRKEQRQNRATRRRRQHAQQRIARVHRDGEAADRAGDHHPFDAQVQNTCFFHHKLAHRRQQQRGRRHHRRGQQQDRVD